MLNWWIVSSTVVLLLHVCLVCGNSGDTWVTPSPDTGGIWTSCSCCVLAGNNHYHTFDVPGVDHYGVNCTVLLVAPKPAAITQHCPAFSVTARQVISHDNPRIAETSYIVIEYPGQQVRIKVTREREVYLNGFQRFSDFDVESADWDVLCEIEFIGLFIEITCVCGLKVTISFRITRVCLPHYYSNNVLGMCGDWAGPEDEDYFQNEPHCPSDGWNGFTTSSQYCSVKNPIHEDSCVDIEKPSCTQTDLNSFETDLTKCGVITDVSGPFQVCITSSDVEEVYMADCVNDMCMSFPSDGKCPSIEAFAAECELLGFPGDENWRDITGCNLVCSDSHSRQHLAPSCPATCANPVPAGLCNKRPGEACICPADSLELGNNTCVALQDCSCINEWGLKKQLGNIWLNEDCTEQYSCESGGVGNVPTVSRTFVICDDTCLIIDEDYVCMDANLITMASASIIQGVLSFDGARVVAGDNCKYIACTEADGVFQVLVKYESITTGSQTTRVKYIEYVTAAGQVIQIDRSGNILVNGVTRVPAFSLDTGGGSSLSVHQHGNYILLKTSFSLQLAFGGYHHLQLLLPQSYAGKVHGLFGNLDHNSRIGDPLCKDSSRGITWKARDCKTEDPEDPSCTVLEQPPSACTTEELWLEMYLNCKATIDKKGPFAQCFGAGAVEADFFLNECMELSCEGEGTPDEVRCGVLEAMAYECSWRGFPTPGWRFRTKCTLSCSDGMVLGGSGCPATCSDPSPQTCDLPDIDVCVCPEGLVQHEGTCISPQHCPCILEDGTQHQVGDIWLSEDCSTLLTCSPCEPASCRPQPSQTTHSCSNTEVCEMVNGVRGCFKPQHKWCTVHGDPHYNMFDGGVYHFQGSCAYTLVSNHHFSTSSHLFSVKGLNKQLSPNQKVKRLDIVEVEIEGNNGDNFVIEIHGSEPRKVKVNGEFQYPSSLDDGNIVIADTGSNRLSITTTFGLVVVAHPHPVHSIILSVKISLPYSLKAAVWGLCGDNNWVRNPPSPYCFNPDLSTFTSNPHDCKVDHPLRQNCVDDDAVDLPSCDATQLTEFESIGRCGMIRDTEGPFSACLTSPFIVQDAQFTSCVYDACYGDDAVDNICSALQVLAAECAALGFIVDWRGAAGCEFECPEGMDYSVNVSGCQPSCSDPHPQDPCLVPPAEGCFCPDGQVLFYGKQCMQPENCPCFDEEGVEYQVNSQGYYPECQGYYQCSACTDCSPPVPVFKKNDWTCTTEEKCEERDGILGCHLQPQDGGWSDWNEWSDCADSVDGTRFRVRTCDNPLPLNGGLNCPDQPDGARQSEIACIVDGGWNEWTEWSSCDRPHNGKRFRHRQCINPAPQQGGADCPGTAKLTEPCGEFFPFGVQQGDEMLAGSDDGITPPESIPQGFQFYSTRNWYYRVYTNGYVTLGDDYDSISPIEFPGGPRTNIISPFWFDADGSEFDRNTEDNVVFHKLYYRISRNTPLPSSQQLVFDMADSLVQTKIGDFGFVATHVILATWSNIVPYPASVFIEESYRAMFQLALIQDFSKYRSYVVFLYASNSLPPYFEAGVGWQSADKINFFNYWSSLTLPDVFQLAEELDDSSTPGVFGMLVNRTTSSENEEKFSAAYLCARWAEQQELYNTDIIRLADSFFPPCPCNYFQALFDPWYTPFPYSFRRCFITSLVIFPDLLGGRVCCYRGRGWNSPLVTEPRFARPRSQYFGSIVLFNPWIFPSSYFEEDYMPKEWCCQLSDNCDLYYHHRPLDYCTSWRFPVIIIALGDPHIQTLDGYEYTFNGLGEYHMMISDNFTLQARTLKVEPVDGSAPMATIFGAFSAQASGSPAVQVELSQDRNSLNIIEDYGKENYTTWFYTDPPPEEDEEETLESDLFNILNSSTPNQKPQIPNIRENGNGITYKRELGTKRTLIISFSNLGISLRLSVEGQALVCVVSATSNLMSATTGLYGNFDGNPNNDLLSRNGELLSPNSTDEDIHFRFGETWKVKPQETIMYYPPGKSHMDYNNETFTPSFGTDSASPEDMIEAQKICGNNKQCTYDYLSTKNKDLATSTEREKNNTVEIEGIVKNSPPVISGPSILYVTVGKELNAVYSVTDKDGDQVELNMENIPSGAEFNNATGAFTWTPIDRTPAMDIGVVAKDDHGALAVPLNVTVILCDCSSGQGHSVCNFTQIQPEYKRTDSFQLVKCQCFSAWTGSQCEQDYDGCKNNACGVCQDIEAVVHNSTNMAFNCTGCPTGMQNMGTKCIDIDECNTDTHVCDLATSSCENTHGSFLCVCKPGFNQVEGTLQCEDVNECELLLADCAQSCTNTPGSYQCGCYLGNSLSEDGKSCTMLGPVKNLCSTLSCEYGCRQKVGEDGVECFCKQGFELTSASNKCEDVNECTETEICGENGNCINKEGGYSCTCEAGYKLDETGKACVACPVGTWGVECVGRCRCKTKLTPCNSGIGCSECPVGWKGGGCDENVDECTVNPGVCGQNAVCTDVPGSYKCTCNEGYVKGESECIEEDYCLKEYLACMNGGLCKASFMSFTCECKTGFNGKKCEINIDECASTPCQHGGTCMDGPAYFVCLCPSTHRGPLCEQEKSVPPMPQTTTTTTTVKPDQPGQMTVASTRVVTLAIPISEPYNSEMASPASDVFQNIMLKIIPQIKKNFDSTYGTQFLDILNSRLSPGNTEDSILLEAEAVFTSSFITTNQELSTSLTDFLTGTYPATGDLTLLDNSVTITGADVHKVPLSFTIINMEYSTDMSVSTSQSYTDLVAGLSAQLKDHLKVAQHEAYLWTENYIFKNGSILTDLDVALLANKLEDPSQIEEKLQSKLTAQNEFLGKYQILPSSVQGPEKASPSYSNMSDKTIYSIVGTVLLLLLLIAAVIVMITLIRRRQARQRRVHRALEETSSEGSHPPFMWPRAMHWRPAESVAGSIDRGSATFQFPAQNIIQPAHPHADFDVLRGYRQKPDFFRQAIQRTNRQQEFFWLPSNNNVNRSHYSAREQE